MLSDYRVREEGSDKIEGLRLKVAFNYAVFLYELYDQKVQAVRLMTKEIQTTIEDFEKWQPGEEDEISDQVELMKEQNNLWKEEVEIDDNEY